jgi:hypothetical protein
VTITGCHNVSNKQEKSGNIDYFIPSNEYSYTAYAASEVESAVSNSENGAGPTLQFIDGSSIQGVAVNSQVIAVEYYTLDGRRLAAPQHGLNLRIERMANGQTVTTKVLGQ